MDEKKQVTAAPMTATAAMATAAATTAKPAMKKELTYADRVIKKIAGIATDSVQGVLTSTGGLIGNLTDRFRADDKTIGIDADVGKRQVALDLNVVCEYGRHVPRMFDEVAERVGRAVHEMTGLELVELNMHVDDVLNKADFEELRRKMFTKSVDGTPVEQPQSTQPAGTRVQ